MIVRKLIHWIEFAARFGHMAKGVVYLFSGIFSLLAVGGLRKPTGSSGTLSYLATQPFGRVFMVVIAVGLLSYSLWCATESYRVYDKSNESGHVFQSLLKGGVYLFKGGFYGYLCLGAFELAFDTDNDNLLTAGNDSKFQETLVGIVLSHSFGTMLIYLVGIGVASAGAYQAYAGLNASFRKKLLLNDMDIVERWAATWIGRMGVFARGIVFVHVGYLICLAAYRLNPTEVATPGEALKQLEQQLNPWLFATLALGLVAYGLHLLVLARYRDIE